MADSLSKFEQMFMSNGPIQTSIIQNLTRWELRNFQLAGVRVPRSRDFQKKHEIPNRCDQGNPEKNAFEQCANTTKSFDEIRACIGHPLWVRHKNLHQENWAGAPNRPCLRNVRSLFRESNPEHQLNTAKYPIHTKVCRRCRDFYAFEDPDEQLQKIAEFQMPLCKKHSFQQQRRFPLNVCHCFDYVHDEWRCCHCYSHTMCYLIARSETFRESLTNVRIPWSQPFTRLRSLWAPSEGPVCPIEGCLRKPWLDRTRERMQMCLACCSISKI